MIGGAVLVAGAVASAVAGLT
ncbi:MAG: hypothetical protein QOG94_3889, partial [Solirubrobacteraceae bacterium]|nr:hypothetical protein [Solirubrobacteraceae bacterium]